eukprot:1885736-Rhodomonas_salina.2
MAERELIWRGEGENGGLSSEKGGHTSVSVASIRTYLKVPLGEITQAGKSSSEPWRCKFHREMGQSRLAARAERECSGVDECVRSRL